MTSFNPYVDQPDLFSFEVYRGSVLYKEGEVITVMGTSRKGVVETVVFDGPDMVRYDGRFVVEGKSDWSTTFTVPPSFSVGDIISTVICGVLAEGTVESIEYNPLKFEWVVTGRDVAEKLFNNKPSSTQSLVDDYAAMNWESLNIPVYTGEKQMKVYEVFIVDRDTEQVLWTAVVASGPQSAVLKGVKDMGDKEDHAEDYSDESRYFIQAVERCAIPKVPDL